ncbi:MAG: hypothetical protein K8S54_00075 [Spirochaetia bacterium]|nr:hypothetical protein [Spirochaetia bacterium]
MFRFLYNIQTHARARMILVSFAFILCSADCLTTVHTKTLQEYANARREFDTEIVKGNVQMAKGIAYPDGSSVIALFSDTLQGPGRLLRFEGTAGSLRLSETSRSGEGKPALIVRQNACCMEDAPFRAVIFSRPGEPITVDTIVREKFQFKDAQAANVLGVIDFTNVYSVSAYLLVSENGVIKSVDALIPGSYETAMERIDWKVRSRPIYFVMHLGYLVSVPLDIVTAPLQGLALLLTPPGAK